VNPKNASGAEYYGYMLGDLGIRLDEAEALVQRALRKTLTTEPISTVSLDLFQTEQAERVGNHPAQSRGARKARRDDSFAPRRSLRQMGRSELAAAEWEKSLLEWHRSLPADMEADKVAELEKKISQSKHRVAQKSTANDAKP